VSVAILNFYISQKLSGSFPEFRQFEEVFGLPVTEVLHLFDHVMAFPVYREREAICTVGNDIIKT